MNDYNPEDVPVKPAATVMLVDDRPNLQVFMMERNANTVFAGGMWVFPGGQVDAVDSPEVFEPISTHRTDAEASRLLELDHGGLAYYVAAIREAFEEAGILLALNEADESPLDLSDPGVQDRFDTHRDKVNADSTWFIEMAQQENLLLDAGQMHYVARWITPVGSPRRFDARFFVSRMPLNQTPLHDDDELVHSEWYSPQEILEREAAGDMVLMSPTLRMVRSLARFDSADQVIEAAASNLPDERAKVNANRELVLPGDAGYDDGDENLETGFVRLRPITKV